MRFSSVLPLGLPLLVSAQQQIPFLDKAKDLLGQAQAFINDPSAVLNAARRPVTSTVSRAGVTDLTFDNWKDVIQHSGSALSSDALEPIMVLTTGGNKSCGGQCARLDKAWDVCVLDLVLF